MFFYNIEGEMRHTESGERFVFKIDDSHQYNQKRYEAIGEVNCLFYMFLFLIGAQR